VHVHVLVGAGGTTEAVYSKPTISMLIIVLCLLFYACISRIYACIEEKPKSILCVADVHARRAAVASRSVAWRPVAGGSVVASVDL